MAGAVPGYSCNSPEWERFDGSTAEFIYRMPTDPQRPFSTARYFDIHWFFRY